MIIRIMTEGQYELEGQALTDLDHLDDSLLDAVANNDGNDFTTQFQKVLTLVRERGSKIPDTDLVESDLILPAPDMSLAEARKLFSSYPRTLT